MKAFTRKTDYLKDINAKLPEPRLNDSGLEVDAILQLLIECRLDPSSSCCCCCCCLSASSASLDVGRAYNGGALGGALGV